jgi:type I restriction enzyme R subunit
VAQRPPDLTRAQLRELRLELDKLGYSEANLRRARQDAKNEEITAPIIGFVRQAAIGDALIPFEERCLAKRPRWALGTPALRIYAKNIRRYILDS